MNLETQNVFHFTKEEIMNYKPDNEFCFVVCKCPGRDTNRCEYPTNINFDNERFVDNDSRNFYDEHEFNDYGWNDNGRRRDDNNCFNKRECRCNHVNNRCNCCHRCNHNNNRCCFFNCFRCC